MWRRRRALDGLDDEIRDHIDRETEENVARGMTPEEAHRQARLKFGNVVLVAEDARAVWSGIWLEQLRQDVRYALRLLRKSPLFTSTAVLSLAVGIAGNAAIFSIADALYLRAPAGIIEPDRLVDISGPRNNNLSYPDYVDYRDQSTLFDSMAAYREAPLNLGLESDAGAVRVYGGQVGGSYFDVLRVPMVRGRGFRADEDRVGGGSPVTVLSHATWQRHFGGDPAIIGRTIHLNRRPYTVVGVAAPGFSGNLLFGNDLWIPLSAHPDGQDLERLTERRDRWLQVIGRLKPGVTVPQARAQLERVAATLARTSPDTNGGGRIVVRPSGRMAGWSRESTVAMLVALLFALVGLILLIACTNIGSMLMARGTVRAPEMATRLSLGASRARVVRQLVTESMLLGIGGALVGVGGAVALVGLLRRFIPALPVPIGLDFQVEWRVVGFSVTVALAAGIVAGLLPALQSARTDLTTMPRWDRTTRTSSRLRQTFVVLQVGMSMLLVVCAILLGRALGYAQRIDPGFTVENLDVVQLDFRLAGYDDPAGLRFTEELLQRVSTLAGIESASTSWVLPLTGLGYGLGPLWRPGESRAERDALWAQWNIVGPGYFTTMGTRLLRGRPFGAQDRQGAPGVAIVSRQFARQVWPGDDAIGQHLIHSRRGEPDRELVVVGVAADVRFSSIVTNPNPFIYVPSAQYTTSESWLIIRTNGQSSIPRVRELVAQLDPALPIVTTSTLNSVAALALLPNRVSAWLAGAVGAIGLFLAALGIYGITAFNVAQRTREIGVRVALGAMSRDVLRLVVGGGLRLATAGILLGALAAVGAARLLTSMLYGVPPIDVVAFGGAMLVFACIALVASIIPARRALTLDPVEALRTE